jgi:hypothetical protein
MAADLMSSTSFYWYRPEVVKAVLMAGAIKNIAGYGRSGEVPPKGVDYLNSQFYRSTSYFEGTNSAYFDSNNNYDSYFQLTAGARYRIAVVWSDPGNWPYYHGGEPQMNLDLTAYQPNGTTIEASSMSVDNTYEILDFVAQQTGQYKFRIHRTTNKSDANAPLSSIKMALTVGRGDL